MSSKFAVVSVPKFNNVPVLNLPAGHKIHKRDNLWHATYEDKQMFFYVLRDNPGLWVAFVSAPAESLVDFSNLIGVNMYLLTPEEVRDRLESLVSLGFFFDNDGRLLVPHSLCGQSIWITPADPVV